MVELNTIIKIINIVIAVSFVVLAIFKIIKVFSNNAEKKYIRVLMSCYYIVFAVILIVSEFNNMTRKWFKFQEKIPGKGYFLLFIGVLLFDLESVKSSWEKFSLIEGIVTLVYSVILIVIGHAYPDLKNKINDDESAPQPESNKN